MIFLLSLYVLRLSLLSTANGINLCGTRKPKEDDLNEARQVAKEWSESVSQTTISNQPTITINTVWHRITSGNQGNSENDITNSMVVLNNAFAPHFKFNLKKKNVSTKPDFWNHSSFSDGGMRMILHEGDCSTLNIYSTKATAAGYAEFPSSCAYNPRMDGVVISYDTVPGGSDPIWNKGHTLVHEVGHWMNLFHTFEGGCSGIGDAIMDTPASRLIRGCPSDIDSCPSAEGMDLINNFMDYTDDSCRTSFTRGQFTAMKAAWYKYRYSGPTRPTTLPTNAPSVIGVTNEPTRLYTGKQFSSLSELKGQAMAYCASPDTYDTSVYGAIEEWDVSQMTSMDSLFVVKGEKCECNPDVGKWDVSRVKMFFKMFASTTFNQDISAWDVSNGEDFIDMFVRGDFNQDISRWNVSKGREFDGMFGGCVFNQSIGSWNVSKGVSFYSMFYLSSFNQDISSWDVSNCLNFGGMFYSSLFNQNIGAWDVSTGISFHTMFTNNYQFNQDISSWDVHNANNFDYMFYGAESFNQNISSWDLSGGTTFLSMLGSAKAFNQNLDSWLKWLDKDGNDSSNWCNGATCVDKCIGLDKESCLNEEDICKYSNKKKILGDCQYKKKVYKHDCTQYTSSELCLSGFFPGMCTWNDNICSHVCDGLSQKSCKSKQYFFQKICTTPKIKNPCLGCHSNSEC